MPSVPSKPGFRSNSEQDVMTVNDSTKEIPNLFPEINAMTEKALLFSNIKM